MSQEQVVGQLRNGLVGFETPNPEVVAKAKRRRFSAQYKLTVLQEADRCTEAGQIGALLRREGLYSSHLTEWRRQREAGMLAALAAHKRGRKPSVEAQRAAEMARLVRENERLAERVRQAEAIIDAQKKLCELLGTPIGVAGEVRA